MALQLWMPLTGDLRNQGLSNFDITTLGTISWVNGKLGAKALQAGNASQTTNGVSINSNLTDLLAEEYSISVWVKPLGNHVHYNGTILSSGDWNHTRWAFGVSQDNTKVDMLSNGHNVYVNCTVPVNEWTHLVCTCNSSNQIRLYKNGEYITYITRSDKPQSDDTNTTIGRETYAGGYFSFNGVIQDLRLYDHCLSEMEVKQLSQGLILHYPLNREGWGQKNLLKNSSVENSHKYNSNSLIYYYYDFSGNLPTGTYTCSFDIKSSNGKESAYCSYATNANTIQRICSLTNISSEWTHYSFTFNVTSTSSNDIFFAHYTGHGSPFNAKNEGYIYVKNIKLENGSIETPWSPAESDTLATTMGLNGITEYDTSGYCNNGTRTGTFNWISNTPKYNVSTKFSANIIKDTTFNFTSNTWTAAFWYYFDTAPSAYQGFLCLSRNAGSDADKKFAAMPNSSYIWFKFENTSLTVSSLKTKAWTHIVMTFDGTNGKVYENGILKGTTSAVSSIYTDCDDFIVGARANAIDATATTCQLVGNMSDVRVYATALSPTDVKSLYQNCATIDPDGTIRGQIRS